MKIFVTSDTHFNHENIIKYCNRPFKDSKEMNEIIIKNWNEVVSNNDIVYHLGDFGFGTFSELQDIFNRLNGIKYLVMGNHDYKVGKNYYLDLGFTSVYKKVFEFDKYIFTHRPILVEKDKINVYGHIHDKPADKQFDDSNHLCACLDKTDFKPILLLEMDDNE